MSAHPETELDVRPRPAAGSRSPARHFRRTTVVAGAASAVAGLLHYAVAAVHLPEWPVAALLFTLVGGFQFVWAVAVRTEGRRLVLIAGAVVNLAVLAVWGLSRFIALPVGHHAGERQTIGAADTVSAVAELVVVVAALLLLRRTWRQGPAAVPEDPGA